MLRRVLQRVLPTLICLLVSFTCAAQQKEPGVSTPDKRQPIVTSTIIEKSLDELRSRFPDSIAVGFEELFDTRPEKEPHVDLGPREASLQDVLRRIQRINPKYRIDLLPGELVHVYPATGTADPLKRLDMRLREFPMPVDSCLEGAMQHISEGQYARELTDFLIRSQLRWNREHGITGWGVVGDSPGLCGAATTTILIYRNVTVRHALNLMARRSVRLSRGEVYPNSRALQHFRPLSWRFRFRRDANANTGLGGVPMFQTF